MSDAGVDPVVDAGQDSGAAGGVVEAAPEVDTRDYKALYEREVADRIKERNLYKPLQQAMRDLDEPSIRAIHALADMARRGDVDGIVDWSLATVEGVTGKSAAEIIAARQAASRPAVQVGRDSPSGFQSQPGGVPLDAETVRRIAAEEAAQAFQQQQVFEQINQELRAAGYEPGSAEAAAVIRYAAANRIDDLPTAIRQFEAAVQQRLAARQAAAVAAAGATPAPAPSGVPAGSAPAEMSPREAAIARLRSLNPQ